MQSRFMCLMLAILVPVFSHAAAIPKAFQGEWANTDEPPKTCVNMEGTTRISADGYGGYEFGCSVKKVTAKGKKTIVVKLLCGNEMGDYKDSVTLTLTDTKHLDITNENGTQIYHRCPRSKK
jgi:hypothetical protein